MAGCVDQDAEQLAALLAVIDGPRIQYAEFDYSADLPVVGDRSNAWSYGREPAHHRMRSDQRHDVRSR